MAGPMFFLLSAFLNVLVHSAPSSVSYTDFVLKESFTPPSIWFPQDATDPDHSFTLRIDLARPDYYRLEEQLLAVSDPSSSTYGQHLTIEQVHSLTAPTDETLTAVNAWLEAHEFDPNEASWSPSRDRLKLTTTVSKAQEMLNTTYHVWTHSETKDSMVQTTNWSLPAVIAPYIASVHPTNCFIHPKAQVKARMKNIGRSTAETSDYKTTFPTRIDIDFHYPSCKQDFDKFFTSFVPQARGQGFKVISIQGDLNSQNISDASIEADLDTQYAFGVSAPIPGTVYTTGGMPPFIPDAASSEDDNEPYLDFVDFLLANPTTTGIVPTISTSYVYDEQSVPPSYAQQVCDGFAKLGSMSVSIFAASGDGGVGSNLGPGFCISNNGLNWTTFIPTFPASCPFVTTVGATTSFDPEVAVKSFASGGGFSNYTELSKNSYVSSLGNTYEGLYNKSGRAYPDLAAQGDNFQTIVSGELFVNGGTSASTPTVAGLVALLNDARIAAGKPTLGFLNPLLYTFAANGLIDITIGNNPGCGTPGFSCAAGWDPVTGWGTPNFAKPLDIVLQQ